MTASFERRQQGVSNRAGDWQTARPMRSDCLHKEHSGHTPELLTPSRSRSTLLAQDAAVVPAEIRRGRLAVQKSDGKYSGINKLANHSIDSRLAESLDRVRAQGLLVDANH